MPTSPAGSSTTASARGQGGFTLVELLVVLTVIALITALATPLFQRALPGFELKAAVEDVRGAMRQARDRAIRDNVETWVTFDVAAGTYERNRTRVALPDGVRADLLTAERERTGDLAGRIRFHPDGTSTGGRVRLIGSGGSGYEVTVDWFDGGVAIDDIAVE